MIPKAPISLVGDVELFAKRVELEEKIRSKEKLTQFEATYLDAIITEQNRRKGI